MTAMKARLDPRKAAPSVIAVHHHRREREVLVNPEALGWGPVVLDGSQIKLEMLEPDANAPDHLIERWRRRCEQERERR